jgi:hypothetical protein
MRDGNFLPSKFMGGYVLEATELVIPSVDIIVTIQNQICQVTFLHGFVLLGLRLWYPDAPSSPVPKHIGTCAKALNIFKYRRF